jgi:AraC-like DNA-binding protein
MDTNHLIEIAGFIHIIAGLQGLFLVVLLNGYPAENRKPNRILSLLILAISIITLGAGLGASGAYQSAPHLIRIGAPFVLLLGPVMLFYITALRIGKVPGIQLIHLLPFFLYLIWLIPFYLSDAPDKVAWVEVSLALSQTDAWINLIKVAHVFLYLAWIYKLLGLHRDEVGGFAPDLKETDFGWIRKLTATLLFIGLLSLIVFSISAAGFLETALANYILGLVMAVIIYYLGYRALTQPQVFGDRDYPAWQADTNWKLFWGSLRFDKETVPDQDHVEKELQLLEQLQNYMEKERPYKNSDLSLAELSSKTKIPQYLLSRIINGRLDQNFFDFVNEYRIKEVTNRLKDPADSQFTILSLAMDAGFNSKSSFNSAFRKSTGTTPSAYRKNYPAD